MTTNTDQRLLISLRIPSPLAKLIESEARETGASMASLARGAVKWHRGEGLARHPDRPPIKLPARPSKTSVQKGMLLDEEDVAYLDKTGGRIGLARTATLLLILVQYLGVDPLPPAARRG